jgi:hypothetical protein
MATVMPCVDDFLPVHNLASLGQLAEVLSSVAAIRPVRKQRVCTPEDEAPAQGDTPVTDRPQPDKNQEWLDRVNKRLDVGPTLRG